MAILVSDERNVHPDLIVIDPVDPKLFLEPVDFLLADHYRQRMLCRLLDALAVEPPGLDAQMRAEIARNYLRRDMPWHIADEEIQLFPRLRDRAVPTDGTSEMLALLEREHTGDQAQANDLLDVLDRLAEGLAPLDFPTFAANARSFAEVQRRHLAWENAMVIPLARRLLTAVDKVDLGRKMARRRALAYPG
jgi:hemerythrin-like domain-containing protein